MGVGESVRIISLLFLLACVLLLLLHLDCVMNHGVVTHNEAVKYFNLPTVSKAYHTPAFIEEHFIWSDTLHDDVTNLHLIVFAIHSVVDHQHTWPKDCHTG